MSAKDGGGGGAGRSSTQRNSKLASAVRVWDARRSRAGSLSSSVSSMLSVHTSDTSSSVEMLATPRTHEFPRGVGGRARSSSLSKAAFAAREPRVPSHVSPSSSPNAGTSRGRALNVMVFTDLVVFAAPDAYVEDAHGSQEEQRCVLLEGIGLSRILDVREQGESPKPKIVFQSGLD